MLKNKDKPNYLTRYELVENGTQEFIKDIIKQDSKVSIYDYGMVYITTYGWDKIEDDTMIQITRNQLEELYTGRTEEWMNQNGRIDLRNNIKEKITNWN